MPEEFDTVLTLVREKKIHRKLMFHLVVLFVVTFVYGGIFAYDVVFKGLSVWIAIPFVLVSYLAGRLVFSNINRVAWDAKRNMFLTGGLDFLGFILIASYFLVRFSAKTVIGQMYHSVAIISGLSFAVFFGMMLGRLLGTLKSIHRAHLERQ